MKKINWKEDWDITKNVFKNVAEDNLTGYSAQCAYFTTLSLIPFIILLITLIQYTGIDQQTLFDAVSTIIPESMNDFVLGIVKEVYSKSIGTISISLIFIFWGAGRGLLAFTKGLHKVYRIKDKKINSELYLNIKSFKQTIIFLIVIILSLGLLVFRNTLRVLLNIEIPESEGFSILNQIFTECGIIIVTFFVVLLIYKFMPQHKVKMKEQIPGAIEASIILTIISLLFSKFLFWYRGFSIIYGSLTTIMLFLMWTYFCYLTIFSGGELNYILYKRRIERNKKAQ